MAKIFGHSEVITGMKFTYDCKRLITVSGDSCIFVWHLSPEITACMKHHLMDLDQAQQKKARGRQQPWVHLIRRETYITVPSARAACAPESLTEDVEEEEEKIPLQTPTREETDEAPACILTNGKLPMWAKILLGEADNLDSTAFNSRVSYQPQGRWAERADQEPIKTMLDVESSYFTPIRNEGENDIELEPQSLDQLFLETESSIIEDFKRPEDAFSEDEAAEDLEASEKDLYGAQMEPSPPEAERKYMRELPRLPASWKKAASLKEKLPDKICSATSLDSEVSAGGHRQEDQESLASEADAEMTDLEEGVQPSSSLPQTPEPEKYLKHHFETLTDPRVEDKFEGCLKDLKTPEEEGSALFLNPRLSMSARFLSRCQRNSRFASPFLPRARPPVAAGLRSPQQEESLLSSPLRKPEKPPGEALGEPKEEGSAEPCGPSEAEILIKSFEANLQPLCSKFQEALQLYDQMASCDGCSEAELLQVRHLLLSTFCWMKKELDSRAIKQSADAATATEGPTPWPKHLHDSETGSLLRHYSDLLLKMVQMKLDETSRAATA